MSAMRMLIRRELWEHRAISLVPLAFGALFIAVNLLAALGVVKVHIDAGGLGFSEMLQSLDAHKAGALTQLGMALIAVSLNTVMLLVTVFYLLDCLYAERKDRSNLFWKSLPVSDLEVVGSKLLTAALVIPLVTLVIFTAVALCMYAITGHHHAVLGNRAVPVGRTIGAGRSRVDARIRSRRAVTLVLADLRLAAVGLGMVEARCPSMGDPAAGRGAGCRGTAAGDDTLRRIDKGTAGRRLSAGVR